MSNLKDEKFLVIVESPNKVKTVSNILKKAGYNKAIVMASVGHIMELQNGGPCFNSGIYPADNFRMSLKVAEDKTKVVANLKLAVKTSDKVYLMTDGDREGEVISWSLIHFLKLKEGTYFRAITHEITPKAIIHALENPVPLDMNLVEAGLARMRLDKLIGFGLSPVAKRYIGAKSVGRCQSVGLALVVDRENEITNFIPELYYELFLDFEKDGIHYPQAKYIGTAEEPKDKFSTEEEVNKVIKACNKAYIVKSVQSKTRKESPKPPFCTATFQQEAANKIGLKVKDAMSCAQKLYEGISIDGEHIGLITYMRTDDTEYSPEFIPELKSFIESTFGPEAYTAPRKGKKSGGEQNGHEALRVVDPTMTPEKLTDHLKNDLLVKVYKLIWQRTIASAMPDALYNETIYTIENNGHLFRFSNKTLESPGYLTVYNKTSIEAQQELLAENEELKETNLSYYTLTTHPKPRYTEAALIKELQAREIGRPSTYATIVETILSAQRGYSELQEKEIVPTERGIQLANFLNRAFSEIINLNYTKEMETSLDLIAEGKLSWLDFMNAFYSDLLRNIEANKESETPLETETKECPLCGAPMAIRRSRFGKLFWGCTKYPKCTGIVNRD
ncbi:MAG: type I DNA topoisomerase [Lachnospiraceae bacterium]|nr:type I DNA topoisomerase [Lachnospiraceae bacterium]